MRRAFPALAAVSALACRAAAETPRQSVILVSMDTVRADRLGVLGNPDGLTTNLDGFAAESVVFTEAYAQANTTAMSHASVFTSRYPSELGSPGPRFALGEDGATLAEVLGLYGWDTAGFTAGLHLDPGWGLARGFATYEATPPLGSFWHTLPAAADWLEKRTSAAPRFLFVHGYDAHAPYLDPAPYGQAWADSSHKGPAVNAVRRRIGTELVFGDRLFKDDAMLGFLWDQARPRPRDAAGRAAVRAAAADPARESSPWSDRDAEYARAVYDGGVAYADALFGWFLQRLRRSGAYDNAIIVVMSDHGEGLGEEGRFGHGDATVDAELHVPLIIHVPGGMARRVDAQVALLDILPTILDLAGATLPADVRGHSLRPWLYGAVGPQTDTVFAEGSLREVSARSAHGRLTFSGLSAGSPWLSPLLHAANDTDPAWNVDTAVPDASTRASLRAALEAWREQLTPVGTSESLSPALLQEAREHGYFTP